MRSLRFLTAAAVVVMSAAASALQKNPPAPAAPLPPAIQNARSVFLSNLCDADPKVCASMYNQLYSGLQAQGRYKLVLSPIEADLVLEMHFSTRLTDVTGSSESGPISSLTSRLQLVILDRATRTALWSITEPETRKVHATEKILSDLNELTK